MSWRREFTPVLHDLVRRLNWREEFVADWKGDGVGLDCPKIVCVLLNKIVLSMSYYSLSAHNITPSLLMIIALIRGNCLALSVSCYIGVLHRSIHLALPWRILQIDSLAFLVRRLLLFDINWNRTLCRELIYLMKSPKQQLDSIV